MARGEDISSILDFEQYQQNDYTIAIGDCMSCHNENKIVYVYNQDCIVVDEVGNKKEGTVKIRVCSGCVDFKTLMKVIHQDFYE